MNDSRVARRIYKTIFLIKVCERTCLELPHGDSRYFLYCYICFLLYKREKGSRAKKSTRPCDLNEHREPQSYSSVG